ncbi:NAD(P)H-binding protein [Amycolatopsis endophytica]|uniref:Uncharacterized protein YbjT (DUF2867 family) n=1 Tax=Amycolatopsis endophytica TaxID=860233 RepID=A0A853B751_9PSEU|nr:NAD(P)H-binding protein [Amycolatopsis endophytica]NYI90632.1 uncharacterized protein YbjT (DUF2867 family) [Amycolatopsis endophytica]
MIVVTTPTGRIGRQLVTALLDAGAPVRVIARDPSRIAPEVRERIEIVTGSHGDRAVVDEAFAGADAVLWLRPPDIRAPSLESAYLDFTRTACDAFVRHGVARVVGISSLGRGIPGDHGLVSMSLAMDDLIAGSGVAYRALTMPSFMDNVLEQAPSLAHDGVFFGTAPGDHKRPTCATKDIAAAAARLLLDDSWRGRGEVPVLGPEDLSQEEMAVILSEVLSKPVRYQEVAVPVFRARLLEQGWSEAMAQGMAAMMAAKNDGLDNAEPRTPEATTPTTFRQFCQEVLAPAVRAAG